MDERRIAVIDRRSNWRQATAHVPPDAREALALRQCVHQIRLVLAEDDNGLMVDADRLRCWLDTIDLAVSQLDEVLRPTEAP